MANQTQERLMERLRWLKLALATVGFATLLFTLACGGGGALTRESTRPAVPPRSTQEEGSVTRDRSEASRTPVVPGTLSPKSAQGTSRVQDHIESGKTLADQGLLEEAIAEFDKAVILEPENSNVYTYRGIAYKGLMQYEVVPKN